MAPEGWGKAVGFIECQSVARATLVADGCLKTAPVALSARTTCPGKYLIILSGGISAVQSAVDYALRQAPACVVDSLVLGNIDPGVLPALAGTVQPREQGALGVVETFSIAAAVRAADVAAKAAGVEIVDLRAAQGLGGKGLVYFTGEVGAVQSAVEAVAAALAGEALLVDAVVIAAPHPELRAQIF